MAPEGASHGGGRAYPPLPRGRHGLSREFVESDQRRRLVVAVAEIAHESGVLSLSVSGIARRAHVSRKTFYDFFVDKEECIGFACAESQSYLFDPVREASNGPGSWLARVDAGLGSLLERLAAEPQLAELCLVHSLGLGGCAAQREGSEALVALLKEGRASGPESPGSAAVVEEFVAGAIIATLVGRIRNGEAGVVAEMHRELVQLAAQPFIGVEAAARYAVAGGG